MRALVFALCLVGCKKHPPPEPAPEAPAEPSRGHSFTPYKHADAGSAGSSEVGEQADHAAAEPADGGAGDAATADAPLFGGNGAPAYRDDQGHVHGPGGPVFMGRGLPCDASRDHCMRAGVWFAADTYDSKHLFRAVPAFEYEQAWWNWRGAAIDSGTLLLTERATPAKVKVGSPIVVWLPETDSSAWAENEYDALTSSRWDVAVVLEVDAAAKTFRIPSWPDPLPLDNGRVVVQQRTR